MNSSVALAIGTTITTLAALTTFLVLFSKATGSALYAIDNASQHSGDENNDDDNNHWWNNRERFDLKGEEWAAIKIAANALALSVACATLFVPIFRTWHPTRGSADRFNMGVLAASTFFVGNAMFVSFWNSANFMGDEEDENGDGNNNNGNDDDAYEMDEEELLAYHRKVMSTTSLILALIFSALSVSVYAVSGKLPESVQHSGNNGIIDSDERSPTALSTHERAKSAAIAEVLSEMWKYLSFVPVAIFSLLLLVAIVMSLGEDGERNREEMGDGNLIIVLVWMILTSIGSLAMGRKILGASKLGGTFGVGALFGGTMYFALLLFVAFALYLNFEIRREDGAGLVMSLACFFLSLVYLAFSLCMFKLRESFLAPPFQHHPH